jgi:hypothetical protein
LVGAHDYIHQSCDTRRHGVVQLKDSWFRAAIGVILGTTAVLALVPILPSFSRLLYGNNKAKGTYGK